MDDDLDGGSFGPAMMALDERRRRFVLAVLDQRRPNAGRAAKTAGFQRSTPLGFRVAGHRLMHDDRVIAALHEQASRRLQSAAYLAADVLVNIAGNPKEATKERRAAAVALLDRVGFAAEQNINVNKTVTDRTGAAMVERIEKLARALGVDPAALLGVNAVPVPHLIEGEVLK